MPPRPQFCKERSRVGTDEVGFPAIWCDPEASVRTVSGPTKITFNPSHADKLERKEHHFVTADVLPSVIC